MNAVDMSHPWMIAMVAMLVGLALGVGIASLLARRSSGSKSLAALREEFDEYRDDVDGHFEKTSELFREMTEKYRDIYNHLAAGAQSFGKNTDVGPRLEIVEPAELPPAGEEERIVTPVENGESTAAGA